MLFFKGIKGRDPQSTFMAETGGAEPMWCLIATPRTKTLQERGRRTYWGQHQWALLPLLRLRLNRSVSAQSVLSR